MPLRSVPAPSPAAAIVRRARRSHRRGQSCDLRSMGRRAIHGGIRARSGVGLKRYVATGHPAGLSLRLHQHASRRCSSCSARVAFMSGARSARTRRYDRVRRSRLRRSCSGLWARPARRWFWSCSSGVHMSGTAYLTERKRSYTSLTSACWRGVGQLSDRGRLKLGSRSMLASVTRCRGGRDWVREASLDAGRPAFAGARVSSSVVVRACDPNCNGATDGTFATAAARRATGGRERACVLLVRQRRHAARAEVAMDDPNSWSTRMQVQHEHREGCARRGPRIAHSAARGVRDHGLQLRQLALPDPQPSVTARVRPTTHGTLVSQRTNRLGRPADVQVEWSRWPTCNSAYPPMISASSAPGAAISCSSERVGLWA